MVAITHSDLEVNHFLGKRRHVVVEAELILANALGREDEVALSFFRAVKNDLVTRPSYSEIDVE